MMAETAPSLFARIFNFENAIIILCFMPIFRSRKPRDGKLFTVTVDCIDPRSSSILLNSIRATSDGDWHRSAVDTQAHKFFCIARASSVDSVHL